MLENPNGPLPPKNPLERVGGEPTPPFPVGFVEAEGRVDPQKSTMPGQSLKQQKWDLWVAAAGAKVAKAVPGPSHTTGT